MELAGWLNKKTDGIRYTIKYSPFQPLLETAVIYTEK